MVLVAKNRASSPSLPVPLSSAMNEGGGNQGTLESESIVTEPNEVYTYVSVPSQPATYENVNRWHPG